MIIIIIIIIAIMIIITSRNMISYIDKHNKGKAFIKLSRETINDNQLW